MSILGWWMVQTTVLPVATTFFTALITIAAARASKPEVGSSINMIDGLATSSTARVNRLRCSVDKPPTPAMPTKESLIPSSSIVSRTSFTNSWGRKILSFNLTQMFKSTVIEIIMFFKRYHTALVFESI